MFFQKPEPVVKKAARAKPANGETKPSEATNGKKTAAKAKPTPPAKSKPEPAKKVKISLNTADSPD